MMGTCSNGHQQVAFSDDDCPACLWKTRCGTTWQANVEIREQRDDLLAACKFAKAQIKKGAPKKALVVLRAEIVKAKAGADAGGAADVAVCPCGCSILQTMLYAANVKIEDANAKLAAIANRIERAREWDKMPDVDGSGPQVSAVLRWVRTGEGEFPGRRLPSDCWPAEGKP